LQLRFEADELLGGGSIWWTWCVARVASAPAADGV